MRTVETKHIGRKPVAVRALKVVEGARKAVRMERKLACDADINVDSARLKIVKDATVYDTHTHIDCAT